MPRLTEEQYQALITKKPTKFTGKVVPEEWPKKNASSRRAGLTKTGVMNKTEAWYAEQLEMRKVAGEILWWDYEIIKVRCGPVGERAWYTTDFLIQLANGELEIHETKGVWDNAAKLRFKNAANLCPIPFVAIEIQRKPKTGYEIVKQWSIE